MPITINFAFIIPDSRRSNRLDHTVKVFAIPSKDRREALRDGLLITYIRAPRLQSKSLFVSLCYETM
jgi:hypothetical protein